jgi:hypothetical protein
MARSVLRKSPDGNGYERHLCAGKTRRRIYAQALRRSDLWPEGVGDSAGRSS